MNIERLKKQTFQSWAFFQRCNGALVQPENFELEVSTLGNLEDRATWEKAYARFTANGKWDSGLTEIGILYAMNYKPGSEVYELRELIMDEYLMIPGAFEHIVRGLELIYNIGNPEEKADADGILELVGRKQDESRRLPTGLVRRLPAAQASAS